MALPMSVKMWGMATGHRIELKGFRLDPKSGKIVRDERRLNVVERLKRRHSAKIKPARGRRLPDGSLRDQGQGKP